MNYIFISFFLYKISQFFFNLQWQETAQTRPTFSDQCAPRLNQMPYSGPGLRLAARCVCACGTHARQHYSDIHTHAWTLTYAHFHVLLMYVIFYRGGSMQDAVPAVSDGRKGRGQDTQKFLYPGQPAQVNLDFRYTRAQAHTHTRARKHTRTHDACVQLRTDTHNARHTKRTCICSRGPMCPHQHVCVCWCAFVMCVCGSMGVC
jgi:hypothetical protein